MPGPYESQSSGKSALHTAETELVTATERARLDLERAREELGGLERTLAPLAQTAAAFSQVTNKLSDIVITAAGEMTRCGAAARPFLPFIEQLADIARESVAALHELQRQSGDCRARVRTLQVVTEQSRAALDRLGPAVTSLAASAAMAARASGPAIEVVAPVAASDRANRVAQLTDEVVQRARTQRATGPKN
jgi:hypothetical protein